MTEWQPIETMPEHKYHVVGRWCGGGAFPYWNQVLANWFLFHGGACWSFEEPSRPSPFYDNDGNYALPTHWQLVSVPPCIGNDPGCPCQDGDACHYRDIPGSPGWPVPGGPEEYL